MKTNHRIILEVINNNFVLTQIPQLTAALDIKIIKFCATQSETNRDFGRIELIVQTNDIKFKAMLRKMERVLEVIKIYMEDIPDNFELELSNKIKMLS